MRILPFLAMSVVALLALLSPGCSSTPPVVPLPPLAATNKWAKEISAFDAMDTTNPPPRNPIVFTGSSSIRLWTNLTSDFPDLRVMNRGFGGSELSDMREHFERLILRYHPRQVVIYCGGNDLNSGKPVERVVGDLKALVDRIHRDLPKTKVVYISIALNPARWNQREKVIAANRAIADYLAADPRNQFLDVSPAMLGPDGLPKPDIFRADKLHMNRKGYELWAPLVRPLLAR
jgi:lysophospholipase L1-like esterase